MNRRDWLKSAMAAALGAAMEVMPDLGQVRPNHHLNKVMGGWVRIRVREKGFARSILTF